MKARTRKSARVSESAEPRFTEEQFVAALMSVPEFRESLSPADAILDAEDVGWIGSRNMGWDEMDRTPMHRERMVRSCRAYWHGDPLAKQAVRLRTVYAVGTGITYKAGADNKPDTETQKLLDDFWKHRKNRRLTNSHGQQRLAKKWYVDGELFFAIFGATREQKIIRTIDCLQIADIISDPNDEEEILCYKRIDRSTPPKTTYYRDWAADEEALAKLKDPETKEPITVEEDVVVYHLPYDDLGKRGNSLLSSIIGWTGAHRTFMEKRVSITAALARFAWKVTAKGGQKVIDDIKAKMNSSLSTNSTTREKNPPSASGGTWAQNQGVNMEAMPRGTGAGDAKSDGDQLKLMVCAGVNLPQHYFGDASDANLATATAMELPVLKDFSADQEVWKDAWRDIFAIVLDEDIDEEPLPIQIALPAMLQDDIGKLGIFLEGLHAVFPEISVPEILQLCLVAIGVPDVAEAMKSMEVKRAQLAAATQQDPTRPAAGRFPKNKGPVSEAEKVAALNKLSGVLQEVFA